MKKEKKSNIIVYVFISIVVLIIGFCVIGWPLIQRRKVDGECKKGFGSDYVAVRNDGQYNTISRFVCKNSKGKVLDPQFGYELSSYDDCDEGNSNARKPIIYIYPNEKIDLSIKLGYKENITVSYPKYNDGWNIIANPDGTLIDKNTNRELYSLYWEGKNRIKFSTLDGFVVKGEDTIEFLEEKLSILGLNERESEEFIIYWLPKLESNKYNYIRFASMDEINANMPLDISIKPDSLIRVFMLYKELDDYTFIKEQELISPKRDGFVVVEWGGSELK